MNCSFFISGRWWSFFLKSRWDALQDSKKTLREMSRLGLAMHIRKGDNESKTEAVFSIKNKISMMHKWSQKHFTSRYKFSFRWNQEKAKHSFEKYESYYW